MKPEELQDSISSRESFIQFLEVLIADRFDSIEQEKSAPSSPYSAEANGWENTSLESFLKAMHAWVIDSQALSAEPKWRDFAQLLLAGKSYE